MAHKSQFIHLKPNGRLLPPVSSLSTSLKAAFFLLHPKLYASISPADKVADEDVRARSEFVALIFTG